MDRQDRKESNAAADAGMSMMLVMALMMGLCFGSVLLFSLVPLVGWPVAVTVAVLGIAAMVFLHQRLMGHGRH